MWDHLPRRERLGPRVLVWPRDARPWGITGSEQHLLGPRQRKAISWHLLSRNNGWVPAPRQVFLHPRHLWFYQQELQRHYPGRGNLLLRNEILVRPVAPDALGCHSHTAQA